MIFAPRRSRASCPLEASASPLHFIVALAESSVGIVMITSLSSITIALHCYQLGFSWLSPMTVSSTLLALSVTAVRIEFADSSSSGPAESTESRVYSICFQACLSCVRLHSRSQQCITFDYFPHSVASHSLSARLSVCFRSGCPRDRVHRLHVPPVRSTETRKQKAEKRCCAASMPRPTYVHTYTRTFRYTYTDACVHLSNVCSLLPNMTTTLPFLLLSLSLSVCYLQRVMVVRLCIFVVFVVFVGVVTSTMRSL